MTARELFEHGVRAAQAEHWSDAVDAFEQSIALDERPGTVFNLALALDRAGNLARSVHAWERFLEIAPAEEEGRAAAQAQLTEGRAKLGTLALTVSPSTATTTLDGEKTPSTGSPRRLYLDPGLRTLAVHAPSHQPRTLSMTAEAGTTLERTVQLEPLVARVAAPPPVSGPKAPDSATTLPSPASQHPADPGRRQSGFWRNPFVWVTAGVLVAAAGVTTDFVVSGSPNEPATSAPPPTGGSVGLAL